MYDDAVITRLRLVLHVRLHIGSVDLLLKPSLGGRQAWCRWCGTVYSRALSPPPLLPRTTAQPYSCRSESVPNSDTTSPQPFIPDSSCRASLASPPTLYPTCFSVLFVCCLLPSCEQRLENGERFHIMFAIQLIRCPFLNPRIRGVVILSNIIDVIVRNAAR